MDSQVIIIGSGIGGLICGCYLSKAGYKVLILEQHSQPGGYCTSFDRKGFRFDVGVHYLGSLRENGIFFRILKELELIDKIKFLRNDPTDRILLPNKTFYVRSNSEATKEELIKNFPDEKENIIEFFNFIFNTSFLNLVSKTKSLTFKQLLDEFFEGSDLKAVFKSLLGNMGLPSTKASALVAIVLLEEYILDGGYYPAGGVQTFADKLANRFKEFGGQILFSSKVTKIKTTNTPIKVIVEDGRTFTTKIIVSNADANLTFSSLLDSETPEKDTALRLTESPSAFVIYLGLNKKLNLDPKHYTTWYFETNDIDHCYGEELNLETSNFSYLLCTFASQIDPTLAPEGKDTLRIFVGSNYHDKLFWTNKKNYIYSRILKKTKEIIGDFEKNIEVSVIGTPWTFQRYTSNKNGALFGWAATPKQIDRNVFAAKTSIPDLYLAGHWVTNGIGQGGVATVALSGKTTAELIIKNKKL